MVGVLSPYFALRPHTRELCPFFEITDFSMSLSRLRSATSFCRRFLDSGLERELAHLSRDR
jgi:hypothetical protein